MALLSIYALQQKIKQQFFKQKEKNLSSTTQLLKSHSLLAIMSTIIICLFNIRKYNLY